MDHQRPALARHDADPAALALAGIASTERGTAPRGGSFGTTTRRAIAAALTIATMLVGSAAFERAGAASAAQPNGVRALAGAPDHGPGSLDLVAPLVGIAAHPDGNGYWLLGGDGGVFAYGDARFFGSTGGLPLVKPVVGMAATPSGGGYWLVASDGGVFTFGDAAFFGSTGGLPLHQPVVGMAATPTGAGYWLIASDGGVFSFGDAQFFGSPADFGLASPVVGLAPTADGQGYWVAAADGAIYAFGDARFHGSAYGPAADDIVGIAATGDGGYAVAHATGAVDTFGTHVRRAAAAANSAAAPTVAIATRARGGYWTAQGVGTGTAALTLSASSLHAQPFLVCTRSHESSHVPPLYDTGYNAVDPSGTYRGAYQFSRSTWNNTAVHAGRPDLVGVDPAQASVADQDQLAWNLYQWQGASPWLGRCAGL